MTLKEREDRFIKKCEQDFNKGGKLTMETETLLRYGFGAAAMELNDVAFVQGVRHQQEKARHVIGIFEEVK